MKKIFAAFCAAMLCVVVAFAAACGGGGDPKPQKLKDGTAITLTEGDKQDINLSEYISLPEGYSYEVSSSAEAFATVTLSGATATVKAVKKGSAKVTAKAGEVSVEFAVTVNEKTSTPIEKDPPVFENLKLEYDLKDEASKMLTLAPKTGDEHYVYSYALKVADENVTIVKDKLTAAYAAVTEKTLTVTVSYTDSEKPEAQAKTVEFTIAVKVTDSRVPADENAKYKVKNGSFDNGLNDWEAEGEIGIVSEEDKFWADPEKDFEGYPVHNVGKYFAGNEAATGKLKSSLFEVGGANKITFMLGAAGNPKCYVTLENAEGTVLALWRNTKFHDIGGGWQVEEIGKTQFANNLVTYVADLSDYAGQSVRVVLNDNATQGFGFINFDEFVTYYATAEDLPAGATAAVNELANKAALQTEVDAEITAQGEYTLESFNAYTAKVESAKAVLADVGAKQTEVDDALSALHAAKTALTLRAPEEKAGAEKSFSMLSGAGRTLNLADYVNENDLGKITYEVTSNNTLITVGTLEGKNVPLTAGTTANDTEVTLTISVKYDGTEKLSISVKVTVTAEPKPVLRNEKVERDIDIYSLAANEKGSIKLDFAANVDNNAGIELTYSVTLNGNTVTLDGDNCTVYNLDGNYDEDATDVTFVVTVKYGANNSTISYNYNLHITDTTAYRLINGDFDHCTQENNYLDGWTLSNPDLGAVNADTHYWLNDIESAAGYPFGNKGNFFNAYAKNVEGAMGTLTSSPFEIGGSGYITYQLGAAKNKDKTYIDIIEKDTGAILARYYNNLWQERTENVKSGCTLIPYKANLSEHKGKTVYIRITDMSEGDYGLFFVDSFETYYKTVPEVANTAENVEHPANIRTGDAVSKYQVYNGGFESGLEGWTCVEGALPGAVSHASTYFNGTSYEKVGTYLFTAVEGRDDDVHDPGLEYRIGTIRSEKFTLKANAWISFKLGGANYDTLGIRIVKTDGTVIARFQNTNVAAAGEGQLVQYKYHFDNAEEVECYIEIFDNEPNGDGARPWRLVVVDGIITDLEAEPAEGIAATNQIS